MVPTLWSKLHGLRIRWAVWAGLSALIVVAAGCVTTKQPDYSELLWPEPPLTPRIKFVGLLRSQDDLGKGSGAALAEALAGVVTTEESLEQPMALAPSPDGKRLYVSDYARSIVFVFDFDEHKVTFIGNPPHGFKKPFGVAVDDKGNVYVVDSVMRLIRVFDASGGFLRNIQSNKLERPTGIAIDSRRGRIYVADSSRRDSENHVVHIFGIDGTYIASFGGRGAEEGKLLFPTYLALDQEGNVYVTDTLNARVQVFSPEGKYLKTIGQRGDAFGMFDKPKGVALDTFGNVYVVDSGWSNVQIFNQRGQTLLYFAGRGRIPGLLFNPTGLGIDSNNRVYVADAFNARVGIYQLINTRAEDSFLVPPSEEEEGN